MTKFASQNLSLVAIITLTSACAGLNEKDQPQPSQLERLESVIEQCLANQVENTRQLSTQTHKLDEMTESLQQIQQNMQASSHSTAAAPLAARATPDSTCPVPTQTDTYSKLLVGQRELVWLQDLKLALPARIDTGAETSSLDARNIQQFERNGKNWIRFEILNPLTQEPVILERRLKRKALILQSNSAEAERRPVIKLSISMGAISQSAEFTLSDRGHLDYQILVGRNILKDVMIVDVSKENLVPPPVQADANQTGKGSSP